MPDTCRNTCIGACPGVGGKPACGSWDFESSTPEGLEIWNSSPGGSPTDPPSAYSGSLTTSTQHATSGVRSLAIGFDGDGNSGTGGRFGIELRIRLCPTGQALDLRGRTLRMDLYAATGSGSPAFLHNDGAHYFEAYNGTQYFLGAGDFNAASDVAVSAEWTFPDDSFTATDIVFWFRAFAPWRGTVHVDNIRIE
jgi:hypothetical protein